MKILGTRTKKSQRFNLFFIPDTDIRGKTSLLNCLLKALPITTTS